MKYITEIQYRKGNNNRKESNLYTKNVKKSKNHDFSNDSNDQNQKAKNPQKVLSINIQLAKY